MAHKETHPAIHYWGTPVILISTQNEDGTTNVAPMSSAFWLGWTCMLGLDCSSQTVANLERERECVLNLASADNVEHVNALALTTGARTVPMHKRILGYESERNKLGRAGLTTLSSLTVKAPRLEECVVHLEAVVQHIRPFAAKDPRMGVAACSVELQIVRTHVDERLLMEGGKIDPDAWRPLIMSFRALYALGSRARSRLEHGDETSYAPWKQGPVMRAAAAALGFANRLRYGRADE